MAIPVIDIQSTLVNLAGGTSAKKILLSIAIIIPIVNIEENMRFGVFRAANVSIKNFGWPAGSFRMNGP